MIFCCVFHYQTVGRRNQRGSRKYDDLQNLVDKTSHENPVLTWHILRTKQEKLVLESRKYLFTQIMYNIAIFSKTIF